MELKLCLQTRRGAAVELGRLLGVPAAMVHQWAAGRRPVTARYVPRVVQFFDGAVREWELRPDDWHLIWPDLRDDPAAPSPLPIVALDDPSNKGVDAASAYAVAA